MNIQNVRLVQISPLLSLLYAVHSIHNTDKSGLIISFQRIIMTREFINFIRLKNYISRINTLCIQANISTLMILISSLYNHNFILFFKQ